MHYNNDNNCPRRDTHRFSLNVSSGCTTYFLYLKDRDGEVEASANRGAPDGASPAADPTAIISLAAVAAMIAARV